MAPKRTRSGAKVNGKEEAPVGPRKYTRKDLKDLIYHPVRPLDVISEEIGIKAEDIAKLDANENLHPVPAEMMKAVTDALQSLGSGCSAQIYPDPSQTHFRAAIAKLHGLTPDMVVAGSGSDDILDIIMRVIDADSCIICPPTFGMYKFLGTISKIKIIEVARKDDFHVDIPAVVKAIRANKCKLVMLPSPNNPTGTLLPNEDIKVLCAEDCIICVDEAYAVCVCARARVLVKVWMHENERRGKTYANTHTHTHTQARSGGIMLPCGVIWQLRALALVRGWYRCGAC
jgi:histidinol-phosphate aminotransferase